MEEIGKLVEASIRKMWPKETDFSDWLEKNPEQIGKALGMEPVDVRREVYVFGQKRADLVFRDEATEDTVVVENMLEKTDDGHLGQLVKYAAGLDAACAVLISPEFGDEHRSALTWLNSISKDVAFFGVVLEAWHINSSPAAPRLRVEVKPDQWRRRISATQDGTWSERQSLYYEFWDKLLPDLGDWHKRTPQGSNSLHFGIGRTGFDVYTYLTSPLRAALKIKFGNDAETTAAFEHLREQKDRVEKGLGESAEWHELDGYGACWITLDRRPEPMEKITEREKWADAQAWLVDKANRLRDTIRPLIQDLPR